MTLDSAIALYVARGYRLTNRTDTSAQLIKPKEFSFPVALAGLLVFFVGLLAYLLYYLAQSDTVVLLTLDSDGQVMQQVAGRAPQPLLASSATIPSGSGPVVCPQCGHGNARIRKTCKTCGIVLAPVA